MIHLQVLWSRFQMTKLYQKLSGSSAEKVWLAALWSALVAGILYLSFRFTDTDLYYIIPTGRYILEHGVPHENPFIATSGQSIVIQNWLYCALTAWIYNNLHSTGLWLFQLVTILAMVGVIFAFFGFKKSDNKVMIGIFTLLSLAFFGYVNLRPEMLTFILIMTEIIGIEHYRDTGKSAYLWILPVSTLLEINCHASYWIMHYVVLLPYCVPVFFRKITRLMDDHIENKSTGKMVLPLFASVAALCANPYGIKAITYVFDALSSNVIKLSHITEQQPFTLNSVYVWVYILLLYIFLTMWWKKKLTSSDFYMYLGFSILLVMAVKWLPFYVISMLFLFRAMYRQTVGHDGYKIAKLKVPVLCSGLICVMVCVVLVMVIQKNDLEACFDTLTDDYLDRVVVDDYGYGDFVGFADYLDEHDSDASVFAIFEQSNYFEYRGFKVFTDARPEIYTKEIAGSDELTELLFKVTDSIDELGYNDDMVAASSLGSNVNKSDLTVGNYCLSFEDYGKTVDSLPTDYFVVSGSHPVLYHYMNSQPDKYEELMTSGQYYLYHRK